MNIQTLIDKRDNFEVIRDQIAGLLVYECENQKRLAAEQGLDPHLFDYDVYLERSNPWEVFYNDGQCTQLNPVVNVWYDGSTFDPSASNIFERQKTEAVFNIDVYAGATSEATENGHFSADELAAKAAQRTLRLVRNILMASINTHLQLKGLVWSRWPQSVKVFQPSSENRPVVPVIGGRLALMVVFNEFSPQYVPETLQYVSIEIRRRGTGQVILKADYDYT